MREDVFAASRAYMGERSSSKTVTPWYDGDEAVLAALGAVGQRLKVREEKIGAGEDEEVGTNPDVIKRETVRLQQARVRIDGLRFRLEKSFGLNLDLGWVYWKNKGQDRDSVRQDAFEARPVSVAMILRRLLFEHGLHSVGFISATMTVQGEFKYISKELGLPETGGIEVVADSPFNLPQQGAIYIPATLPRPPGKNTERAGIVAYDEALARLGMDLIMLCGGRSLLLFTSWDRMKSVLALIRPKLPPEIRCYVQGEVPLDRLIIKFREDERSVLFGVASLWTGIDVPGNSLIGVLIDKIPFPVPTSPVYSEREELVRRSGGNTFMDLAVPMATLALKQGLGRLIRSETDAGVAIVADTRLLEMGYGKTILASLPRFRRLQNLDQGGTTVALALSSHSTEGGEHGQDDLRGLQPVPARDSGDLSVRPVLGGHDAASLGGWDPDDAGAVREGREEGGRAHGEHDPEEQKPA
jgi:Rad3-related DNA helicase